MFYHLTHIICSVNKFEMTYSFSIPLVQELETFFCKKPDGKYFRLCVPLIVCHRFFFDWIFIALFICGNRSYLAGHTKSKLDLIHGTVSRSLLQCLPYDTVTCTLNLLKPEINQAFIIHLTTPLIL